MKVAVVLVGIFALAWAQQMQTPPFLLGAPSNVINEFSHLLATAADKTEDEIDNDVEAWIVKQSPKIKSEYAKFKAELERQKAQGEAAHRAAVAKLSPAARKADAEITALVSNSKIKGREKQQKIEAILNGLPPNVRRELTGQ